MNEHDRTQTQSETRQARRVEDGTQNSSTDSIRTEGISRQSKHAQHLSERIIGSDRAGSNPFGLIGQQVVKRLIWQASDRLQEARDCIDWYENQVDKLTKEIEELEQLEQLVVEPDKANEEE
ncbi:MAG: hypothetical protein WBA13_08405 [Microcoleaceae cyanobacterium]